MAQNYTVRINGLKLKQQEEQSADLMDVLQQKAALALCLKPDQAKSIAIVKKSLDARYKPELFFVYVLDLELEQIEAVLSPRQRIKPLKKGMSVSPKRFAIGINRISAANGCGRLCGI